MTARLERDAAPSAVSNLFRIRADCRACGSGALECVVPLKPLSLASPNLGSEGQSAAAIAVPADLYLCRDCGLLQLTAVVDPAFLYSRFKYVTTISLGLPAHFRQSADEILADAGFNAPGRILEIGSNDGTLLVAFKERGWHVQGIDPAPKAVARALERGVPTVMGFFDPASARALRAAHGSFSLVVANNTLANIDDLEGFAVGLATALAEDGIFVFETSYGSDVAQKTLLDTVYHEHLSYFMVKPLDAFFARHGLELFHVRRIATKGGSIRGYVQRRGASRPRNGSVDRMIADEAEAALDQPGGYSRLHANIDRIRIALTAMLDDARRQGQAVIGWGASVGCIAVMHQLDLTRRLECIFDDQPLLDIIAGPDYRIPVLAPTDLETRTGTIVLLAWRYAEPILARLESYRRRGGRIIVPLPEISVC